MPLVPRRQFGQEAAHGEGEGVTEQGLHLLEKAVAQEEPGGEEPPGQALAHGLRVGHHLRGDGEGGRGLGPGEGRVDQVEGHPVPSVLQVQALSQGLQGPLVEA